MKKSDTTQQTEQLNDPISLLKEIIDSSYVGWHGGHCLHCADVNQMAIRAMELMEEQELAKLDNIWPTKINYLNLKTDSLPTNAKWLLVDSSHSSKSKSYVWFFETEEEALEYKAGHNKTLYNTNPKGPFEAEDYFRFFEK